MTIPLLHRGRTRSEKRVREASRERVDGERERESRPVQTAWPAGWCGSLVQPPILSHPQAGRSFPMAHWRGRFIISLTHTHTARRCSPHQRERERVREKERERTLPQSQADDTVDQLCADWPSRLPVRAAADVCSPWLWALMREREPPSASFILSFRLSFHSNVQSVFSPGYSHLFAVMLFSSFSLLIKCCLFVLFFPSKTWYFFLYKHIHFNNLTKFEYNMNKWKQIFTNI